MHEKGVTRLLSAFGSKGLMGTWVSEAACRGQGQSFTTFPATRADAALIERTCEGCQVLSNCLSYASRHEVEGAWAGRWYEQGRKARPLTSPRRPPVASP